MIRSKFRGAEIPGLRTISRRVEESQVLIDAEIAVGAVAELYGVAVY
jgi:hypothetical protein